MSNDFMERARKLAETRGDEMRAGWNAVIDALTPLYKSHRPAPRSFEVHHATENARKAFLGAWLDGKSPESAVEAGVAAGRL